MGTSFVEYKDCGFWTRDSFLQNWLSGLIDDIRMAGRLEPWQEALVEHWRVQINIDGGCMSLALDEYITDSTRQQWLLSVATRSLPRADEIGRRTGELFIDLLNGRLQTTVSSPIDYL